MPLNIGTKVYRNMQEQVGYLTQLVDELKIIIRDKEYSIKDVRMEDGHLIFELNDGEIIDAGTIKSISSVEINASSHLIVNYTDNTYEDVGLIKSILSVTKNASGHVIISYSDGTSSDLGILKGISSTSLDASKHLIINYDNGTSEDLGPVLSGEYDLTGLDVVAKTFTQSQANYSSNITFELRNSSLTVVQTYNRFEVINNVLYCIVNLKITNNTGSDITLSGNDIIADSQGEISPPNNISSKIVDINGIAGNVQPSGKNIVCLHHASWLTTASPNTTVPSTVEFILYHHDSGAGRFKFTLRGSGVNLSIPNGESRYITGRMILTLI